jgi:hypothetical protein
VTWVGWRLQRTEAAIVIGILALLAALLIPTGIQMANAYHSDGLSACRMVNIGPTCGQRIGEFQSRFQAIKVLANWFTLVPGLIGVLLAAPFILDLEHGTYRLAWTQGITRRRWLAGKLGVAAMGGAIASAALIVLFMWWRTPQAALDGRLDVGVYDTAGIVVLGYTLFALGLALALGAVWRRSAASLTVAFVAYFAARVLDDYWLRNQLVAPLHATWRGVRQPNFLYHADIISQSASIRGHQVGGTGGGIVSGGSKFAAPASGRNMVFHAVYQPASHYWPLQLTETGLFAAVALLLVAFAAWWTHERIA